MGMLHAKRPSVHPIGQDETPDVRVFADLARARRQGNRDAIRPLIAELLAHGWAVFAVEPRKTGRAVRP
jgi:hypothetical protein